VDFLQIVSCLTGKTPKNSCFLYVFDRSSSTNTSAGCGPIMIRLSWHDAGVFNGQNGCPNAAMRLAGGGEYAFGANAGDFGTDRYGRRLGVMAGNVRSQCVFGI